MKNSNSAHNKQYLKITIKKDNCPATKNLNIPFEHPFDIAFVMPNNSCFNFLIM